MRHNVPMDGVYSQVTVMPETTTCFIGTQRLQDVLCWRGCVISVTLHLIVHLEGFSLCRLVSTEAYCLV